MNRNLLPPFVLALALLGMGRNMVSTAIQPDWAALLLVSAVLAHRGDWLWAVPAAFLHDLFCYWQPWGITPWLLLTPLFMIYSDNRIGAALPQRVVALLLTLTPLLWLGGGVVQYLLTVVLAIPVWHYLASVQDRYA